jgi:hypothetical protein
MAGRTSHVIRAVGNDIRHQTYLQTHCLRYSQDFPPFGTNACQNQIATGCAGWSLRSTPVWHLSRKSPFVIVSSANTPSGRGFDRSSVASLNLAVAPDAYERLTVIVCADHIQSAEARIRRYSHCPVPRQFPTVPRMKPSNTVLRLATTKRAECANRPLRTIQTEPAMKKRKRTPIHQSHKQRVRPVSGRYPSFSCV